MNLARGSPLATCQKKEESRKKKKSKKMAREWG